ncbi:MAG: hypothetical protein A2508_05330 [Candidatus Lambdaproteobacteria bacterium RIFOXYD12_FULL_49_8]|uniref:ATP synthase protein I n=1 Tax=Candidatus Lambdaproteobacteria bacterium RIFOXYD2_FULL_50_16 TaxID=1817772 RepID=A0A1F6GB66_9PROT|nr:MAG: hypothetical protein A2527_07480 [Candidatus Lambdaproteobacteria bacterium RIFOXYD2_FULL_50_16]OGG97724.1 MAG: hypothetical protein A2508_05330 [Candidatus Lambdaproteobacteria bacterium RIFOXYD12_FULL_49_8]
MAPETNQNDSPPWLKKLEYSSVGIEMGLSVAVGALIGYGLDKWLGTEPYMLFLWFFAGVGASFSALYRTLQKLKADNATEKAQSSENNSDQRP